MTPERPLRICMVVRALPFHRKGGLEFHTWDLANGLAKRGHEVVLLTSEAGNADVPQLAENIRLEFIPGTTPGEYSMSFFRNVDRTIDRLNAEHYIDIVHAQEHAALFLRKRPGKLVVTVHGTMTSETPLYPAYFCQLSAVEKAKAVWKYKPRLLLQPAFRQVLARADRLIVDSEFTRQELQRMDSSLVGKVALVPLGLDADRYPNAVSETRMLSRIGILGRVQKMKGIEVAVRAARLLRNRGVAFELQIAGTGDYVPELEMLVRESDLHKCVSYVGKLNGDQDVANFLGNLDLLLFPDLTQPAFGLVAVEAMRYGVPVVGARSGAIPEVVSEDLGWLYDPWNVEQLAALLEDILANPALLAGKGAAALARYPYYKADRMAGDVEQVYRQLLESRLHSPAAQS